MKQKIIIISIAALTIVATSSFLTKKHTISKHPKQLNYESVEKTPNEEITKKTQSTHLSIENKNNTLALASDDGPSGNEMIGPGHSEAFIKALENHDMKYELSFDDIIDPIIRAETIKYYEDFKSRGYIEEPTDEIDNIQNAMNQPLYQDNNFSRLAFKPSLAGNILKNEYTYKGYSYNLDNSSPSSDTKMQYLIRTYEKGKYQLVIVEDYINGGANYMQKEYVTHYINDYPAAFYKIGNVNSSEQLYKFKVANPNFSYQLYLNTDNITAVEASDELARVAQELFDQNNNSNL